MLPMTLPTLPTTLPEEETQTPDEEEDVETSKAAVAEIGEYTEGGSEERK